MDTDVRTRIEKTFLSPPPEERDAIISYGVALRLSNLRKRLFLAESKVRRFKEKYKVTLSQLDADGLPDGADYEMHEDYIMWHHWAAVADKIKKDISSLAEIAQQGLLSHHKHVGRRENLQLSFETCLEEVMEVILSSGQKSR